MDIQSIKDRLPDYAKDLKLNLSTVLSERGSPGLSEQQRLGVALASAIAARNTKLARELETTLRPEMEVAIIEAAHAAAAIMGMNNVYYRFVHEAGGDYANMPARLRMNVIANPGVEKADFELMSIAVSAVNGCGLCIKSHERTLRGEGLTAETIQSAIRIAATIHAVAVVDEWERREAA